ncbi:hypothetical protein ACJ41O_006457 [Fusarium nematophilum]
MSAVYRCRLKIGIRHHDDGGFASEFPKSPLQMLPGHFCNNAASPGTAGKVDRPNVRVAHEGLGNGRAVLESMEYRVQASSARKSSFAKDVSDGLVASRHRGEGSDSDPFIMVVFPAASANMTDRELQGSAKYKNVFEEDKFHSNVISVQTEPAFAIGQRAFLLCSDAGNILWDCVTYIDDATVEHINGLGGIQAIVISHPHYFSTALHWAEAFNCKVYISAEDEEWVMRKGSAHAFWKDREMELLDGRFVAVKVAGHFPGSSVLLWRARRKLFIADSILVVPSGVFHEDRLPGTTSFTFMWSYPNMVST